MLALACARAGVRDGLRVAGLDPWGAAALWVAEHHPGADAVAVTGEDEWVTAEAGRRGVEVTVATVVPEADVVLALGVAPAPGATVLAGALGDVALGGHALERRWDEPGVHHARTARAWLANLDADRAEALRLLGRTLPPTVARRRLTAHRRALRLASVTWRAPRRIVAHHRLRAT